jgi:hypothetical protein
MTAATRHTAPGIRVPNTTDEVHAQVPFPPDARPVRNSTIPETKRTRPIQSKLFAISLTVTRFVGLSFKKIIKTAMAKPAVLLFSDVKSEGYGKLMKKHHRQLAC